jgi:hypothetical protein
MASKDQPVEQGQAARHMVSIPILEGGHGPRPLSRTRLLTQHREVEPNTTGRDQSLFFVRTISVSAKGRLCRPDNRRSTEPAAPHRRLRPLPPHHQPQPAAGPFGCGRRLR